MVFVLSVNVNQASPDFRKKVQRRETSVDIDAILPRAAENPFDNQFTAGIETQLFQLDFERRRKIIEQRLDVRLFFFVADDVRSAALAADQAERIEDDRFAGTRLSGEDVESGSQLQRHLVDHGEILDPQLAQHTKAGLTFSPLQFVAQDFVIAARRQLDQRDRQTKIPRLHPIAVVQAHARLPVGNENDGIAERTKRYLNGRLVGNHDGPVGQSVGTDGAQNDCAQGRFQDRSSGGQGIGRGTGRRGYNQAIRPVSAKIIVANIGLQIDDAAARAFGDHGVVENSKFAQSTVLRVDPDLQSHALFNFVISLQSFCQDGLQFVHCYFRDKAEAAQIHTENGDIGPLHQRRDVEQGSIAAQ